MAFGRLFGRREKHEPGSPETQPLHRAADGQVTRFLGRAMHAYPLTRVKGNGCPRCGGSLQQHRCKVAYMGETDPESVETSESWFCTACKSAVLDEKALKRLVREQGDKYVAAIGLDVGKEDPAFFDSWDGEGESDTPRADTAASEKEEMAKLMRTMLGLGDAPAADAPPPGSSAKRKQRKNKRKQTEHARKKNRRKK